MPVKKKVVAKKVVAKEIDEKEDVSTVYIGMTMKRFDPMLAELNASAEKAKKITKIDVTDKVQVKKIHVVKMELLKHRTNLTRIGKMLRVIPNNLRDAISKKEKELIKIVSGEEDRLAKMENEAKDIATKAERLKKLPERLERLKALEIEVEITNNFLLGLDAQEFENYYNECVAEKNRLEAEELEESRRIETERLEKAAREVEEGRLANERAKQALDAEKDAQNRASEAKKLAEEEAERKEEERVAQAKKEAEEALQSEEEAKAKLAKRAEYVKWRADIIGEIPKMDYEERNIGKSVQIWTLAGEFKLD